MKKYTKKKFYTLSEACELLSISTATGRNWMKAGRLISVSEKGQKPLFEENTLLALQNALANGSISGLKSRRNKTCVSGKSSYSNYISKDSPNHAVLKQLLNLLTQENIALDEKLLLCLLRHCAEQLITKAGYADAGIFLPLLEELIDSDRFKSAATMHTFFDKLSYTYIPSEDTLGFLYLSLRDLGEKKSSGSYYTPAWLAKQLVEKHLPASETESTIFDPSCGSGVFLLQLPETLPLQNIYGNDINPLSVALTRINLALKYHIETLEEVELLQKNITVSNFLQTTYDNSDFSKTYDIILGNPPWGAKLSVEEKKKYRNHFSCASGSSMEIYDLFIEQSLRMLAPNGILSFVLPEAVLTVKTHTPMRKLLLQHTFVRSVEYLGEVFEQVHCPSIILTVGKDPSQPFYNNTSVTHSDGTIFSTQVERTVSADFFSFSLTDEDYLLLQKILSCTNCTTLVDNAVFALGIVTGNNSALLHNAPAPDLEPIIKGNDISRYHINSCSGYVAFLPEKFQQTAPEKYYRAPEKLFYRFINKQLTFAYDSTGLLSLNSCNILIPQIPELSVKYVLAILNSSVAQFIFEKKFHSVKVLRSHLEQIPIPLVDEKTQQEIVELVDKLMTLEETSPEHTTIYTQLDYIIAGLYGLTQKDYRLISSCEPLTNLIEPE